MLKRMLHGSETAGNGRTLAWLEHSSLLCYTPVTSTI
jgi:hypothetical protein